MKQKDKKVSDFYWNNPQKNTISVHITTDKTDQYQIMPFEPDERINNMHTASDILEILKRLEQKMEKAINKEKE